MGQWQGAAQGRGGYLDNAAPVPAAPSMGMASSSGHSSSNYSFRNNMFDRNPTTWVPQAPMRNEYESDYSHIYGRLPLPTRFRQFPGGGGAHGKRHVYVSEW